MNADDDGLTLEDLAHCFDGAVPAVIATVSGDGVPNVTFLSRVRVVDSMRVALSNQFFSKTSANIVERPRASVLVLDGRSYEQYRLTLVFERTERRGPVFERLREDIDVMAALAGLHDVFRLRTADIFRVVDIEHMKSGVHRRGESVKVLEPGRRDGLDTTRVSELSVRLSRCGDLDAVVRMALTGLTEVFGYEHAILMLADEDNRTLFTVGAVGYVEESVGSEVLMGEGVLGQVAARCVPLRVDGLGQATKYAATVRRSYEAAGGAAADQPGVPGLQNPASQLAVPAMALGSLVGVLAVEDEAPLAFTAADEAVLVVVASVIAAAVDAERSRERAAEIEAVATSASMPEPDGRISLIRVFEADGSVFVDDEYLVKGVAGRILLALVRAYVEEGRSDFTNRELRLDSSLGLPAVKDNLESRLLLLQRRLEERDAPARIVRTGRGRFRLEVRTRLGVATMEEEGANDNSGGNR